MLPLLLAALLAACGGDGASAPAPTSRVDAAPPPPPDPDAVRVFCDAHAGEADARPFVMPPLAEGTAPPAGTGWRWVNVWATWCAPCVAELPTIAAWHDKLVAKGTAVDLVLVSFDKEAAEIERFARKHPDLSVGSARIRSQDDIAPWLTAMGLPTSTAIPLHVFVDPMGRTRCVRAGAVGDDDLDTVRRILAGE